MSHRRRPRRWPGSVSPARSCNSPRAFMRNTDTFGRPVTVAGVNVIYRGGLINARIAGTCEGHSIPGRPRRLPINVETAGGVTGAGLVYGRTPGKRAYTVIEYFSVSCNLSFSATDNVTIFRGSALNTTLKGYRRGVVSADSGTVADFPYLGQIQDRRLNGNVIYPRRRRSRVRNTKPRRIAFIKSIETNRDRIKSL